MDILFKANQIIHSTFEHEEIADMLEERAKNDDGTRYDLDDILKNFPHEEEN